MKLEEVKKIFEEKAIAGFRILLFGLGKSRNNKDLFPVEVNCDLQNAFLSLLEHPAPKEELQPDGFLWSDEILGGKENKDEDEMSECEFAENHFDMLVHADTHYQTPRRAVRHIKNCPKCKKRLEQYHDIILEPNKLDEKQAYRINETTTRLVQHFSFVDKKVDCQTARRFLPQLADSELPILIPTPISVHAEQCPQCERALEMIRQLKLNSRQLGELTEVYSATTDYEQLKELAGQLQFDDITPENLKEVRKALYCITEYKESGITTLYELGETPEKLKAARTKDLYAEWCTDYNANMYEDWPLKVDVGCYWARPTVASLSGRMDIKDIVAPAFAHINECEQCKDDLILLQELNLEPQHYEVLSEFYWKFRNMPKVPPQNTNESLGIHHNSKRITKFFAQMRFSQLSDEQLEHICLCKECRALVYEKRRAMIDEILMSGKKLPAGCAKFNIGNFFNTCLPSHKRFEGNRKKANNHFRKCPQCLRKVQHLHEIIYGIIDQPESGVVINYQFDQTAAEVKQARDKARLYDERPITVHVFEHGEPKPRPKPIPKLKRKPILEPEQQIDLAIVTCLELHLNYIDQPVNCKVVKPFLSWQADKRRAISEQTPITTHISECPDCQRDIETLKQLNLDQKYLSRLSELFAGEPYKDTGNCRETQKAIHSIAEMDFSATTVEILRHVCICQTCRQLLYQQRKEMLESLPEYDTSPEFPCESVSPSEIFVYTISFGLDPANDQYAKFRPSFTSHLLKCQTCLRKMQELHNTTYAILERPDSGIVTCYESGEN